MNKKDKLNNGYRLDDFGLLFSDEKSKKREKSILLRAKNAESIKNNPRAESSENNSSLRADSVNSQNLGGKPYHSKSFSCHSERSEESKKNPFVNLSESEESQKKNNRDSSVVSLPQNDKNSVSAESNMPPKKPQSKTIKEQDFIYAPQFQGFDEILEESKDFGVQDFNTQNFSVQKQGAESSTKSQLNPQSEKDLLLRHPHTQNDTNALFIAYSILFLMLLAFMPQIYLANNIYTSSKNINLLKAQKDALRDENSDLQKQLESVKFNFLTLEIEEIK